MSDDNIKNLSELEQEKGVAESGEIDIRGLKSILFELKNIKYVKFVADPRTGKVTFFQLTTHGPQSIPWMKIVGFFFIALAVVTLSLLMLGILHAIDKSIYFNVWVALCIAAGGSFLGGDASAAGKLPMPSFLGDNPITFTVIGGIAIFVIVFILMVTFNS